MAYARFNLDASRIDKRRKRDIAAIAVGVSVRPFRRCPPGVFNIQAPEFDNGVLSVIGRMGCIVNVELSLMRMDNTNDVSWIKNGKTMIGIYRVIASSFYSHYAFRQNRTHRFDVEGGQ